MEVWNNANYHEIVFKTFVPAFFNCLSSGLLFDSSDSTFSSAGDEAVRLIMFLHKQNVSSFFEMNFKIRFIPDCIKCNFINKSCLIFYLFK